MTPPDLLHEASPSEIRRLREAITNYRTAISLMEDQLVATKLLLASKEEKLVRLTGQPLPVTPYRPRSKGKSTKE